MSELQKVSHWAEAKVRQDCMHSLQRPKGRTCALSMPASRICLPSLSCGPFLHLQTQKCSIFRHAPLCLSPPLTPSLPPCPPPTSAFITPPPSLTHPLSASRKDPFNNIRHTLIIQGDLPITRSLTYSHLQRAYCVQDTYSQVLGISMQTSRRPCCCPQHPTLGCEHGD